MTLNTVVRGGGGGGGGGGMMCKQLLNTQLDYFILAGSFSPSCFGLFKMCRISGCLQGVWKLSGRRLGLSE